MTDPPSHPDRGDDTRVRSEPGLTPRPRWWVYVWWLIGILLLLLVVVLHLTGAIGPGDH